MPEEKCLLDPNRDCYGVKEAARVEARLDALEKRNGEDHRDFRESIQSVRELAVTLSSQFTTILQTMSDIKAGNEKMMEVIRKLEPKADAVDDLEDDVENLNKELTAIKAKPAQNWEELKGKLLWGVVGVFAAALGAGIIRLLAMGV